MKELDTLQTNDPTYKKTQIVFEHLGHELEQIQRLDVNKNASVTSVPIDGYQL